MTLPARALSYVRRLRHSLRRSLFPQPVYVFHHIPKCGGTSIRTALGSWFEVVPDYRGPWAKEIPPPKDLHHLGSEHILCGHYHVPGLYLGERYPDVFRHPEQFRVFAFVRDPLQVKLSLYYFEKKHGRADGLRLEKELFRRDNYLAQRFPCTLDNYKEVIDKYFFVGIAEEAQLGFDLLADLIGKPRIELPRENISHRDQQENCLSAATIDRFKEVNRLDYALYEYCVEKFNSFKPQAESARPPAG